jgi:hypothetical protein
MSDDCIYKFEPGSKFIFSGPSGSGKSFGIARMLDALDLHFEIVPKRVLYFYAFWQEDLMGRYRDSVEFFEGFSMAQLDQLDPSEYSFVILDDQIDSVPGETLNLLFTKYLKNRSISLALLTQNLYNKTMRVPRINSSVIILYKSPQDKLQVVYIVFNVRLTF